MKYIQIPLGLASAAITVMQLYYVMGVGNRTSNNQPLTALFYILFFWVLWAYARIPAYIRPVITLSNASVRWAAAVLALVGSAVSLHSCLKSPESLAAMSNFGVLNVALMFGYSLVFLVLIFGDIWLGFFAKLLKFGRRFPESKNGV